MLSATLSGNCLSLIGVGLYLRYMTMVMVTKTPYLQKLCGHSGVPTGEQGSESSRGPRWNSSLLLLRTTPCPSPLSTPH